MELKEGSYTSKELCEMVGYDYKKHRNNQNTLINKLSKICTITKVGSGKGLKYIISDIVNYACEQHQSVIDTTVKEGIYTGRELCNIVNYDYDKFIKDPRTLFNKLSKVCDISKVGRGKGAKYVIKNIYKEYISFDINKRADFNTVRKDITTSNSPYSHILTYKEINDEFDGFYVYRHILEDRVIYVGKGSRRRAIRFKSRKYSHLKDKVIVEIIKRFDDELEALKFEKQLIEYYLSIGDCEYNEKDKYHTGATKIKTNASFFKIKRKKSKKKLNEKQFNDKINKDYEKMFKYRI